ncbi:6-phospho-3-hexuloisomerase [Lachnospiraceae bacterium ZAX-1]
MKNAIYLEKIISELSDNAKLVSEAELQSFADSILAAQRIFVSGAGRSGFISRAFSNRLMHLGLKVYFIGEPTTPSIKQDDLLIIGSGSGGTDSLVAMALKARDIGAKIALLTIFPNSTIGQIANHIVTVPGETPKSNLENSFTSFQPMGNLFEQLSWLVYDSIIIMLKEKLDISSEEMFSRHANLE